MTSSLFRSSAKFLSALTFGLIATTVQAEPPTQNIPVVYYHKAQVQDVTVFYREAGDPERPTVLLLHGFPTSSFMYRNLIPLLAMKYHVIAPDLPGFGLTESPGRAQFDYKFQHLADVMVGFTDAIGLKKYAIQVFDYGAPVGLRLALARPDRITAIITQNGNAYEEGLGDAWDPIRKYWREPTEANREALRQFLKPEGLAWQYTHGVKDPSIVSPDTYTLDSALMARPENEEIQLDLFLDYASNVALYPKFQQFFRDYHPPILAVWGQNDPFFIPAGAKAYQKDVKTAEVELYDTGHFALETHNDAIAARILDFLNRRLK
ncbi:alpha/beta hydrolase [Methylobacillus caricis]|uniref:alpha/beta fold hydrolase n=1 Tax=Methylobacillus caricis TaxID=1971611 RepID=UPI001CFFA3C3|nr:alpha/beta hydrolase [Methylobacillus caricis]MCB5186770.1 alpha/beta hydrolase [Methylobacillus caricis]